MFSLSCSGSKRCFFNVFIDSFAFLSLYLDQICVFFPVFLDSSLLVSVFLVLKVGFFFSNCLCWMDSWLIVLVFYWEQAGLAKLIGLAGETNIQASSCYMVSSQQALLWLNSNGVIYKYRDSCFKLREKSRRSWMCSPMRSSSRLWLAVAGL